MPESVVFLPTAPALCAVCGDVDIRSCSASATANLGLGESFESVCNLQIFAGKVTPKIAGETLAPHLAGEHSEGML